MRAIKIAIDDGHGNNTAGKRTPAFPDGSFMKENEFNAEVADLLKEELERCGFQVLMVAPEAEDTPLKTRVMRANDWGANAYISIHANAYGSTWNEANGVETWVYEKVGGSETWRFAEAVHKKLVEATGRKNRGIKRSSDLYVLKATAMHSVILECGFMTNMEEAELLRSDFYRRDCARAIAQGICIFYEKEYIPQEAAERKVYQKLSEVPSFGQGIIGRMIDSGCFADTEKLDLDYTMVRTFVLWDRYERSK
ncbi:N-acetylmuramoyl-L-alanine amidase family protein [Anaerotignum sp.]|uniref:N-acetylmuramoyl-L-alanine amidase family protein n=1 Tax=Anaerotignum sp. TaxID=2039241 RepID=UPI0028AB4FD0|nr:N-acetylmuramoyl-L-alanine amidase [Anaerotignum sp.]